MLGLAGLTPILRTLGEGHDELGCFVNPSSPSWLRVSAVLGAD